MLMFISEKEKKPFPPLVHEHENTIPNIQVWSNAYCE